ncbi:hypothetical protein KAR91_32375 [Candidatus Pacearchaeota archaeon]|nr:hypothetical protein [Candidatus Pacearchaeota archaeon]
MECTLTVRQRIDLNGLLPREATLTAIKMIREVREEVSFSDAEHKKIELKYHGNGSIGWNQLKAKLLKKKKIEIPATICSMIKKSLQLLDKQGKLRDEHIDLFDMFVPPKTKKVKKKK